MRPIALLERKNLRRVLEEAIGGGVRSSMLISNSGDILASAGSDSNEKLVAAILLNISSSYDKSSASLSCILIDCEEGKLAVAPAAGNKFLVCLYGDQQLLAGMLKRKVDVLRSYLQEHIAGIAHALGDTGRN